ncbi:MAG: hypothetical protein ACI9FG_001418 [Crocinitomicaceae bacterium]|jgi:hypothetical protein
MRDFIVITKLLHTSQIPHTSPLLPQKNTPYLTKDMGCWKIIRRLPYGNLELLSLADWRHWGKCLRSDVFGEWTIEAAVL